MGAMDDKRIAFAPFHAINQFMLEEYRQQIIREVLSSFETLSPERKKALNSQIKQNVKVPGFRDATQAPVNIRLRPVERAFEGNPYVAAQVLMAWAELKNELRQQVHDLLKERGWDLIPADADRTRLPGFLTEWPKGEDYDTLGAAFSAKYPQVEVDENDLRLMVVWIGGRLPYSAAD